MPNSLLNQLLAEAMDQKYGIRGEKVSYALNHLSIVPKLKPHDACCHYPYHRRFNSVKEYFYVAEFGAFSEENDGALGEFRAKFSYRPPFKCYKFGHLRVLRVTALGRDLDNGSIGPVPLNMPVNFFPAGATTGKQFSNAKLLQSFMARKTIEIKADKKHADN